MEILKAARVVFRADVKKAQRELSLRQYQLRKLENEINSRKKLAAKSGSV
jgi:hypothetical protein